MRVNILVTLLVALAAFIGQSTLGHAQPAAHTLATAEVPRSVATQMPCKAAGPVSRQAFAGGYVFLQTCSDSGAPMVQAVYATGRDGMDARLLAFHRPEGRRMSALQSLTLLPDGEISGTTGRLTRRICRAEARWRMEGRHPSPNLVYWRQTRHCDGGSGWSTVVGRPR